jgi:hypothetical protein
MRVFLLVPLVVAAVVGALVVSHRASRAPAAAASAAASAVGQAAATKARMDLLEAASAAAAFDADNGGYAGMTAEGLRANYDASLPAEVVVISATDQTYCIEATVQRETESLDGPGGTTRAGPC